MHFAETMTSTGCAASFVFVKRCNALGRMQPCPSECMHATEQAQHFHLDIDILVVRLKPSSVTKLN